MTPLKYCWGLARSEPLSAALLWHYEELNINDEGNNFANLLLYININECLTFHQLTANLLPNLKWHRGIPRRI